MRRQTTAAPDPGSNPSSAKMHRQHRYLVLAAAAFLGGCPASADEVRPPPDQIYFPTGMALSPDGGELFVMNANSDLRFDSGTLVGIDVERVAQAVAAWDGGRGENPIADDCEPDQSFVSTLICTEQVFIDPERSVRIGNFATELEIQVLESGDARLFASVRGDPSLTYIDVPAGGRPSCNASGAVFDDCDDDHRLTELRGDSDLSSIPDEPFGLFVDGDNGYALMTHLSNGAVSLAEAPVDGSPPILTDALGGLFARDPSSGALGAVGAAGRLPGSANDRIYVTSRTESRVQTLVVNKGGSSPATIVAAEFFFLGNPGLVPFNDARDIAFDESGNRAFIINRNPPMLQRVDTSLSETGIPKNEVDGGVELCRQAATIEVASDGIIDRLYVACFQDGQVWAVDPLSMVVESIIEVGRGPQFIVAAPERGLLFVSNFREHTIAVIDIATGSLSENRVVLRIGRPNETEGI